MAIRFFLPVCKQQAAQCFRLAANAIPGPASRRTANGAAAERRGRLFLPPAAAALSAPLSFFSSCRKERQRRARWKKEKGAECGLRCDRRQAFCPQLSDVFLCPTRVSHGPLSEKNMPNQVTRCKTLPPAPCSAKRSVSARKQRRQPIPRLHPVMDNPGYPRGPAQSLPARNPRGSALFSLGGERRRCLRQMKAASPLRSRAFGGPSRSRTAKGICGKAEEPFLFSGKYRKEKWVLICAGRRLHTGHGKRIATAVCALPRNDVQKRTTCKV